MRVALMLLLLLMAVATLSAGDASDTDPASSAAFPAQGSDGSSESLAQLEHDAHTRATTLFTQAQACPAATSALLADRVTLVAIANGVLYGVSGHPTNPKLIITWDDRAAVWQSRDGGLTLESMTGSSNVPCDSCKHCDWSRDGTTLFIGQIYNHIGILGTLGKLGITTLTTPISPWDGNIDLTMVPNDRRPWYAYQKVMDGAGTLYVARSPHMDKAPYTIYSSADRGLTWKDCGTVPHVDTFIASDHGCLLLNPTPAFDAEQVSNDLGKTWSTFPTPDHQGIGDNMPPFCRTRDRVYILDNQDLFTLSSGGELITVTIIDPLFQFKNGQSRVDSIAVDAQDPQVIYLAGAHLGLARSRDGGATWRVLPLPRDPGPARNRYFNDYCALVTGTKTTVAVVSEKHLWTIDDTGHPTDLFPCTLAADIALNTGDQP